MIIEPIRTIKNCIQKKLPPISFKGEPSEKQQLPKLKEDTFSLTTSTTKKPTTSPTKSTAIKEYLTSLKKDHHQNLKELIAIKQQLEKNDLWNINPQNLEVIIYNNPKANVVQLGFEKKISHSEFIGKIYQELFPNIQPQIINIFTEDGKFDKEKTLEELTKLKERLHKEISPKKPTDPTKTTILNLSLGPSAPKKGTEKTQAAYRKFITENIFSQDPATVQKFKYYNAIIEVLEEIAQIPNVFVGVSIGNDQSFFNAFALAKGVDVFTGCDPGGKVDPTFSTLPPGEKQPGKVQGHFHISYLTEAGTSKGWDFFGTGKPQVEETSSWPKYFSDLFGFKHPDTQNVSKITSSDSSRLAIEKFLTGTSYSNPVGLCQKFIFKKIKKILDEI